MAENHLVDGEKKTVIDMTSRELEKAIRERDEARKAAETAQADARSAEESRAKMEADLEIAEACEYQAREDLAAAQKELEELRARPVDVAVEVDREAVEKARAEAAAEMKGKVDAAEKARVEAEERRKDAEKALSKAKKEAGANAEILSRAEKAEKELAEARRQLEATAKADKQSAISSDADISSFKLLLDQSVTILNQLLGLHMKIQGRDAESGEKCRKALLAYFSEGRKRVE